MQQPLGTSGVFAGLFGVWYPTGYVVGVLQDADTADRAAAALRTALGEGCGIRILQPDEVRALVGALEGRTRAARSLAVLSWESSDEGFAHLEYTSAAAAGHPILTVHAPSEADAERLRPLLLAHGAWRLRHYDRVFFNELRG